MVVLSLTMRNPYLVLHHKRSCTHAHTRTHTQSPQASSLSLSLSLSVCLILSQTARLDNPQFIILFHFFKVIQRQI